MEVLRRYDRLVMIANITIGILLVSWLFRRYDRIKLTLTLRACWLLFDNVENCSNTRIVELSYNCCCLLDYQIEVSRGIDGGRRSTQRMVDSDLQIRAFLSACVRASVLV
jgi:hypothetical protein